MKNGYVNYILPEEIMAVTPPEDSVEIPGSFAKILKLLSFGKPVLVSLPGNFGKIYTPDYGILKAESANDGEPTEISLSGIISGASLIFNSDDTVRIVGLN